MLLTSVLKSRDRSLFGAILLAIASLSVAPVTERAVVARTRTGLLTLYLRGSRTHGPAVVLEAGLGDSSDSWSKVASAITGAQVVRYDRAGLGRSARVTEPRIASQIASELHDALVDAHIQPPYVLVSHSAGAWYVVVFAAQHPREVSGLLLVDPTPPDFFSEISSLQTQQERREFNSSMATYEAQASPGRRAEWMARNKAASEAKAAVLRNDVAFVVISAAASQPGRSGAIREYWRQQHERMAAGMPKGRLVVANAGHYVQLEQPQIVVREIQRMLVLVNHSDRPAFR